MIKRMKNTPEWCAPTLLMDTKHNPWPDDKTLDIVEEGAKVAFVDEGHQYYLQDNKRAYPDWIISCSKLTNYWNETIKVLACGDFENSNVVKQVHECMERNNYFRPSKPITEIDLNSEEAPQAHFIRDMLSLYLNTFLKWRDTIPNFNERQKRLDTLVPSQCDKTFKNHLRHAVIRDLENWLLENDVPSIVTTDDDYIDILRYLKSPKVGFECITATSKSGKSLKEYLSQECEKYGPKPPITLPEMSKAAMLLAANAGTSAHKYIELKITGNTEEKLPELREVEDYESIEAMMEYLEKKNIKFEPKNIERRVGSLLYKVCGSMDAYRLREDNVGEVWDWKRTQYAQEWLKYATQKYPDDPHHWVIDFSKINFSNSIMGYHIQTAGYHQLETISNPDRVMSNSSFLGAIHPTLDIKFVIFELLLDVKMKKNALPTTKGIGNYKKEDVHYVCEEGMTSLEYIQCLFHHRLEHLKKHYKTEPCIEKDETEYDSS
jgi:glutaredoxin-related protein